MGAFLTSAIILWFGLLGYMINYYFKLWRILEGDSVKTTKQRD